MLNGKKIVLGITGSIAAYKSCLIIRQLIKKGAEVQVVITPAGKEFITPITLSALTHKPVISDFFSQRDGTWHSHVDLGLWADAMLIAPCTAASLGKMCHGIADNMLVTTYLSMKAPVFIAPAMDLDMYRHPSTQENLRTLQQRAEECRRRGAEVTLVAGPVHLECSEKINRIDVESCQQMYDTCMEAYPSSDAAILCAAVADFKPQTFSENKIKRGKNGLHIDLQSTQDIAAALGKQKKKGQRLVAFALETNNEETNAKAKLEKKNADFIVLNSTKIPGTTFQSDENQITIISSKGKKDYEKKNKSQVARDIVDELSSIL